MGLLKVAMRTASKFNRETQQHQRAINRSLQIVEESLALCDTSKNLETRISRMGVALDVLTRLCEDYPHWPDNEKWKAQAQQLLKMRPTFLMENLCDFIKVELANIESSKTAKTKHNRAEKLLKALDTYMDTPYCDNAWLSTQIHAIRSIYIDNGGVQGEYTLPPTEWGRRAPQKIPFSQNKTCTFKKVTLSGKLAILFVILMLFSPIVHENGDAPLGAVCLAILLTAGIVLLINKRRAQKAGVEH